VGEPVERHALHAGDARVVHEDERRRADSGLFELLDGHGDRAILKPRTTRVSGSVAAELSVEQLVKRFRGLSALGGVTLRVREGEIVGLIGPNGSGKTTLLNVASGVLRPTAGRVVVGGVDATGRRPHQLARLGVGRTFQQIRLFAEMTVFENVEVGAVARGQDPEGVPALLERLGLTADADRLAVTLPYGQQRRVEIARALAGKPRFVLLDEPAAGMNEAESDALLRTIRAIRDDERCAVLIVDHDLRLIMRLCERIHVLAEGRTICEGTAEEVRRDPGVIQAYLGTTARDGKGD
jgi:branched-chain amino acid transport system ATP-binding protein